MTGSTRALIIVAHPDDETLWAGGAVLANAAWSWTIVSLCRRDDADRAPRFERALRALGATGAMGDLDDGPDQVPLDDTRVADAVTALIPDTTWDIVFTHSPFGEYTRHRRHEEIGRAVVSLWRNGRLQTPELRLFAYEDGGREYPPRSIAGAHIIEPLDDEIFSRKYRLITETYGFRPDSWEALATPRAEGFWSFHKPADCEAWMASQRRSQRSDD